MGFLSDDDKDVPPATTTQTQKPFYEEPLPPWYPGQPLQGDPELAKKAWDYGIDPIGKAISIASPLIEPVGKVLGAGEEGLKATKGVLGPIGTAISAGSFLYDCGKLGWDTGKDQKAGIDPYHDQNIYNDMAGVTSNGIHTILGGASLVPTPATPFLEGADAALTTAETITDIAGKGTELLWGKGTGFDANTIEGGLIRYTTGDRSLGDKTGQWVSDKLGGGTTGALAKVATSFLTNGTPIGWGYNLANAGYDAVDHQVNAGINAIKNGDGLAGSALHWLLGEQQKHDLNGMGLPKDNPVLMSLGLGGGNKTARVSAGMGGGVSSALSKPAEGGGGGPKRPHHHLTAGLGGGISPLLRGPREGGGRGR